MGQTGGDAVKRVISGPKSELRWQEFGIQMGLDTLLWNFLGMHWRPRTRPTQRARMMLEVLESCGEISERELCQATGGRNGSGRRAIRELIEEGQVRARKRRGRRYIELP